MDLRRGLLVIGTLAALVGCGGGGAGSSGSSGGGSGGSGGGAGATNSGTATIGATGLPLVVLIGGSTRPQGNWVYLDSRLENGEIFVMPQSALATNTTYTVSINASAGTDTFNHTWSFTTASVSLPTNQATKLGEVNHLRTRSGVPAIVNNQGYFNSALKHSGYQCETNTLTHGEPDSSRRFFINNNFASRITAGVVANGGTGWDGATTVSEDVASNGGLPAISLLWNSVYHRLPMMRSSTSFLGIADRVDAFAHALNTPQVIANSGNAYLTINFGGDNSAAQIRSYWPNDNESNVHYAFNSNQETPDPLGPNSGSDPNSAPSFDTVGTPIHVILPTLNDFNGLTITVTP